MDYLVLENVSNRCFINSTLQTLFHIYEFRQFIISKGSTNLSHAHAYPICMALYRIFNCRGKQNANHLRSVMASLNQEYAKFNDGDMHDSEEFALALLHLLESELAVSPPDMHILDIFRGTYMTGRKFLGSPNGSCVICGNFPGSEMIDTFFFLNLNMPENVENLSLSDLIQKEFSQPSDKYRAKCSSCCTCPSGGHCVCPQREVADLKTLIQGPKYLLVKLLRYNCRGEKNASYIPSSLTYS